MCSISAKEAVIVYKSVRLLFRNMNDWVIIWFRGRLRLSSRTNMAAVPLTGPDAAKKLSFSGGQRKFCWTNVLVWLQWSFKKVDQRFPPAARVPVVEMSRYWFNGLTTQDADLHLPHLFSLCPFTVTELMTSIDQRALLWAWRKGAKGRTEGRIIAKKNASWKNKTERPVCCHETCRASRLWNLEENKKRR